jgi:hypothetical protein
MKRIKLKSPDGQQNKERFNFLFINSKIDELIYMFGGRHCKSDFHDTAEREPDYRQNHSWPASPGKLDKVVVDDPPQ